MIEFIPHASSSAGNLYEVRSGNARLAIELGLPWPQIQRALDFRTRDLDAALVSHAHSDHAKAVGYVLSSGIDVYASEGTWTELNVAKHHARTAYSGNTIELPGFRVLPFDLKHDASGALGFLVRERDGGGDCLAYACDTAYVPYRFGNLTHIAVECNWSRASLWTSATPAPQKVRAIKNHMSLERVLRLLQASDLSRCREVWLLHLSDRHGDEEAFRLAVERTTGKPTYVAPRTRRT